MKVTKDVSDYIAANHGISRKAAALIVDDVFAVLKYLVIEIKDDSGVQIPGFGKFSAALQSARKGRNPATGESIEIPAKRVIRFKAATKFKEEAK